MEYKEEFDISFKSIVTLVVITLIFGGFFLYTNYEGVVLENKEIKNTLAMQNKEISSLKEEFNSLRFENEGKVDEITKRIEQEELIRKVIDVKRETQEQISKQKISSLEAQLSQTSANKDFSSVIKKWESHVAYIECDFALKNSYLRYKTTGSGVVFKFSDGFIKILTNRHVLVSPNLYNLNYCKVKLLEDDNIFSVSVDDIDISTSEYDWGTLTINNPDENLNTIANQSLNLCEQKPNLGDDIIVLGYPGIGSTNGITATEGIISGFDDDYFITSAKVEQGGSGGAAILLKDNCFLGIPTYASLGQVESFARILDIWIIVVKK